jgi:Fur family ferric uptake transcriptional regulator
MPALSSVGRERQTRQRDALMQALRDSARALTPAELCALGQRSVPTLNLSTVYRQLAALLEAGEVLKVDLPGQSARYEVACTRSRHAGAHGHHGHHHHHFHCTACRRVFPIHACPGTMDDLAPPGFRVARHDLTLHGLCVDCAPGADSHDVVPADEPRPAADAAAPACGSRRC